MKENKPEAVIIHHTAVKSSSPQLHAVDRYHKNQGFPKSSILYYVGYHWFIEKDGTTTRTRKDNDEGAHTLGGWNTKSIGICLAGDFNEERPTPQQIVSLNNLIDNYKNLGITDVKLHREAQLNRTCPGNNFTRDYIENVNMEEDSTKCEALKKEIKKQQDTINWLKDILAKLIRKYLNK